MTALGDVLVCALVLVGCVVALSGFLTWTTGPGEPQPETRTDRWRKLTEELPK
jgi:hypothetical protein